MFKQGITDLDIFLTPTPKEEQSRKDMPQTVSTGSTQQVEDLAFSNIRIIPEEDF